MREPRRTVSLREVTADTVRAVCRLVAEPPGFVAPNAVSIAQAYFHPQAWFRAIYADDELVGFVMLEDSALLPEPPAEPEVGLWRFMIDATHKRQGYGRAALRLVIEHVRQRHPTLRTFVTSCVPGPGTPRPFYESLGFVATGEVDDGEEVLALDLQRPAAGAGAAASQPRPAGGSMSERNRALARRWFDEVWNQRREAAVDELMAPNCKGRMEGADIAGPAEFKQVRAALLTAFPDLRIVVEDAVADDTNVAVRWHATGTHQGEGFGFPATQAPLDIRGMTWLAIDNGRIVTGWDAWNQGALIETIRVAHAKTA